MFYFWQQKGPYTMATNSLNILISHMRNLGGDRGQWAIMVKSNQGMVNVPILDAWF